MLHHQGNDVYVFHNQFGHPITLTRQDIDAIAEESADIEHSYVNKLKEEEGFWKDNYDELKSDIRKLLDQSAHP